MSSDSAVETRTPKSDQDGNETVEVRNTDGPHKNDEAHTNYSAAIEHLHPAWQVLIRYCEKLQFGELEKVSIQNGLPMMVEVVRTKMRLRPD